MNDVKRIPHGSRRFVKRVAPALIGRYKPGRLPCQEKIKINIPCNFRPEEEEE